MTVTIGACEAAQTAWFEADARATGGAVWTLDGLRCWWLPVSREVIVGFPTQLRPAVLAQVVERATERGADIVGVWLGLDREAAAAAALSAAGFERGWQPWWMAAGLEGLTRLPARPGVATVRSSDDRQGLLDLSPAVAWHAASDIDGHRVGHAWLHAPIGGSVGGVFDMLVAPGFRRLGVGTALIGALAVAAARESAVHTVVLNATEQGEKLYSRVGFEHVGRGITWWRPSG